MLPDGEQAGKFHVFRIPVLSEPRPRRSDHGPAGPPKVTKTRTVAPRVSEGTGEERRSRGINNLFPRLQRSDHGPAGPPKVMKTRTVAPRVRVSVKTRKQRRV